MEEIEREREREREREINLQAAIHGKQDAKTTVMLYKYIQIII